MADERVYPKEFIMYKARKDGSGIASQFGPSSKGDSVFLSLAKQVGAMDENFNAKFDWDNKSSFKLSASDVGEILAVLDGQQNAVGPYDNERGKHKGLFHKSGEGHAVLYFTKGMNSGFFMRLDVRRGEDKRELQHTITNGEGIVLATLLRDELIKMHHWH